MLPFPPNASSHLDFRILQELDLIPRTHRPSLSTALPCRENSRVKRLRRVLLPQLRVRAIPTGVVLMARRAIKILPLWARGRAKCFSVLAEMQIPRMRYPAMHISRAVLAANRGAKSTRGQLDSHARDIGVKSIASAYGTHRRFEFFRRPCIHFSYLCRVSSLTCPFGNIDLRRPSYETTTKTKAARRIVKYACIVEREHISRRIVPYTNIHRGLIWPSVHGNWSSTYSSLNF